MRRAIFALSAFAALAGHAHGQMKPTELPSLTSELGACRLGVHLQYR